MRSMAAALTSYLNMAQRELEAEQKRLKAKDKGSIKGKRQLAARKKR